MDEETKKEIAEACTNPIKLTCESCIANKYCERLDEALKSAIERIMRHP